MAYSRTQFFTAQVFLIILVFSGNFQAALAQGPNGYTYCANEGGSFTLPARSHVAYGANNQFAYLYNQTGTITFNNTNFGDPAPGYVKKGYYKIATSEGNVAALELVLEQLKNHITGVALLSGTEINSLIDTIQQNVFVLGDTSLLVTQAFDLVNCYETIKGPVFLNANTQGGFANNFDALDGKELARAVFLIQQGVMDLVYTPDKILKFMPLLVGKQYKTAEYFPGACPLPVDSTATFSVKINASLPKAYGKPTAFSAAPARRPTGYYLAPGSLGTVKVPQSLVGKGFRILVGAHTVNRATLNQVKRFFRVTNSFPIMDTVTQIINPFGGGIYIVTPYEAAEGMVDIQLTNVVPAPFFSGKKADATSLQAWLTVQRNNPAPWADFESDKFMMQVPRSWIYNYADPVALMLDWDKRMDVVSKLLGYPLERNRIELYLQVDVGIMYDGYYGIGNPQVNNTYNPLQAENGNKNHWFLRPGDGFWETEFHEMGHAQLFSKFPGETEAAVNVPAAAIFNRLYGMNIDSALGNSFDNKPYISRDQAALNWMVTPNFRAGKPMDISNTTKDEVRYQQRGYAKYIEMAALFGWETIDGFHKQEQLDFIAQAPGDGLAQVDSRIFRFSKMAGADMRPLIHFWGVQPVDSVELKNRIQAAGLQPSKLICDRLMHYKSIIPQNNAEFVTHANAFFGGAVPPGGHPDYGSGWYNIWLPLYNETHGELALAAMDGIIDRYFPEGCPTTIDIPVVTVNNPVICAGQSVTLTASGATTYLWSTGEVGDSIIVTPATTSTYTVVGKTAGYAAAPVEATVTVNQNPVLSVADTAVCFGESATLNVSGAESYTWSNGATTNSITVNPSTTSIYTVIGFTEGCMPDSASPVVEVLPLPAVELGADIVLPAGQDTVLDATGPNLSYVWSTGATTATILVSAAGTYSVTVTSLDGCSSSDMIGVTVTSSSFSPKPLLDIKLVPNPTHDVLHLICPETTISTIEVFDNLGRAMDIPFAAADNGTRYSIDLSAQPPGIYYVRIAGALGAWTYPVVRQ